VCFITHAGFHRTLSHPLILDRATKESEAA
jgi:hypothetical protein